MNYLNLLREIVQLENAQRLDQKSIERLQKKRLQSLLRSASRTEHYAPFLAGLDYGGNADIIHSLPFTSKEEIRDSPYSFILGGLDKGSLAAFQTSGSTGIPLSVYLDKDDLVHRLALRKACEFGCGLTAFDTFAELTIRKFKPNPILSSLGLFRRHYLSIYDAEGHNFSLLQRHDPDIIGLYPSAVLPMAWLNDSKGRPLKLKSVYCAGETLLDSQRRFIQESFSCPVFGIYGLTETGYIAYECPQEHKMHVLSSSHIVEIIGPKGEPMERGRGEIVVTPLYPRAMPLLRYRTGDVASFGACSCGRTAPVLCDLEGRLNDMLSLPDGTPLSPNTMIVMYHVKGIKMFQIIQEAEDLITFQVVPSDEFTEESGRMVIEHIKKVMGEGVEVILEKADSIKRGPGGKRKVVVSKVRGKRC